MWSFKVIKGVNSPPAAIKFGSSNLQDSVPESIGPSVIHRCSAVHPDDPVVGIFLWQISGDKSRLSALQLLTEGRATVDTDQVAEAMQIRFFGARLASSESDLGP